MKKILILIVSIFVIYFLFLNFYNRNILKDSTSFRYERNWTLRNAKIEKGFIRLNENSFIRQDFMFPLITESNYKISFKASNVGSLKKSPIILLYIDNIFYSSFKINSSNWENYECIFTPISYGYKHSFTLRMISGTACNIKKLSVSYSLGLNNYSSSNSYSLSSFKDKDRTIMTNNWIINADRSYITNIYGLNFLYLNSVSTRFSLYSKEYEFNGGKPYLLSFCFKSNKNNFTPVIHFDSYDSENYNLFKNSSSSRTPWNYAEYIFYPISNILSRISISLPEKLTNSNYGCVFTNFKICDLNNSKNAFSGLENLLSNNLFTNGFNNWKGTLGKFSIMKSENSNLLYVKSTSKDWAVLSQDLNVISGAYYQFSCDYKYLQKAQTGTFYFTFVNFDGSGTNYKKQYKNLDYTNFDILNWNSYVCVFKSYNTSKARFQIQTKGVTNIFFNNISLIRKL